MYEAVQFMYIVLLSTRERAFLHAVSEFAYCNPFLPEHNRLEREALGDDFVEGELSGASRSTIRKSLASTSGAFMSEW